MAAISIPDMHVETIEQHIKDDAIKRGYGYESVTDFIITNIENCLEADRDSVGIPIH